MDDKFKIHASYIIAILVATIIILVTVRWDEVTNLIDYLSFALTVSSLLLAIIAIIYSIISTSSFSTNISKLDFSNKALTDTSRTLSDATNELRLKIDSIPEKIDSIHSKVDETKLMMRDFSLSQKNKKLLDEKTIINLEEDFLDQVSFNGLFILYACALSHKNSLPINLKELCIKLTNISFEYSIGFLVASNAAGIITINEHKGAISVNSIYEDYLHKTMERIEYLISDGVMDKPASINIRKKKIIEEYFSVD